MLAAHDRGAGAERAAGVAVGVRDHGHDVPHVDVLGDHHVLTGPVPDLDRRQRGAKRLDDLVLELWRIVDGQELRDAVGAREDVVADAGVGIALYLVEEQCGAAVEVLLDRRDLEVRIDLDVGGDQLAGGLQIFKGRAKTRDVLFHGGDTPPPTPAPSRPPRPATRARRGGRPPTSSSTISAFGPAGPSVSRATAIGRLKRRGPALPGLSSKTPDRCSTRGRCEWPEMITSTPRASGSPASILRSWMRYRRQPTTSVVTISGIDAAHASRSLLPRTATTGAIAPSSARIAAEPMSPACTIRSTDASAATASGRRRPCVSAMTPTTALPLASRLRAPRCMTNECSRSSLRLPRDRCGTSIRVRTQGGPYALHADLGRLPHRYALAATRSLHLECLGAHEGPHALRRGRAGRPAVDHEEGRAVRARRRHRVDGHEVRARTESARGRDGGDRALRRRQEGDPPPGRSAPARQGHGPGRRPGRGALRHPRGGDAARRPRSGR